MDFNNSFEDKNGYTLIAISGSLIEQHQAVELLYEVEHHLINDKNKFALDLSGLAFINNNGMNVLFKILTLTRKNGGEIILFDVPFALEGTDEGKKIEQLFSVCENEFLAAAMLA